MSESSSQYSPPPEGGTRILLLIASFLFSPIVGIIIAIIYFQKPDAANRAFARQALIVTFIPILLACILVSCAMIFPAFIPSSY